MRINLACFAKCFQQIFDGQRTYEKPTWMSHGRPDTRHQPLVVISGPKMKNRIIIGMFLAIAAAGCSTGPAGRRTQVVTFPAGGMVEYNGRLMGREPVALILPQDKHGRLAARSVIRAAPTERMAEAETRVLDPGIRAERVPDRIMLDISPYTAKNSDLQPALASEQPAEPRAERKILESPRGRSLR
jgi:hypothetical protein